MSGGGGDSGRVGLRRGAGSGVGGWGLVVEEVKATAKAERVDVLIVVDVALGLRPELVRVLWYVGPSRRRRRLGDEGVGFHLAELRGGEACSSMRER